MLPVVTWPRTASGLSSKGLRCSGHKVVPPSTLRVCLPICLQREMSVELVMQMDSGEIEVFNAYRKDYAQQRYQRTAGRICR